MVPDEAPDFVKRVTAVMMAGQGRPAARERLPRGRHLARWAPPSGRSATSPWRSPIWDAGICIQCNKCAMVCPHAAIRAKVYDPAELAGAPATFKAVDYKGPEFKGMKYTIQVAPEDCTGLRPLRGRLPRQGQEQPQAQGHRHGAPGPAARARGAPTTTSSSTCPRPTAPPSSSAREGLAVPGAALRVLRRLLRLRRDALHQAADPALRRPRAHRQRHGLLLHLRRQPAHHALHRQQGRPRSRLGQLPLRGQRGVRPGHAPLRGQAPGVRPRTAAPAGPEPRGRARRRSWPRPTRPREAGIEVQRERRGGPPAEAGRPGTIPRPASCSTSRTTW